MKFSVLLPTRNGGGYLENCINSILGQDYSDLELIISDNANHDKTPQIIEQYVADPRVKILRLEEPVSVTDNWNNALNAASGDYILMMGDDDYLLPGYFCKVDKLLERHGRPDCLVYNAYSYVAPGSIGENVQSFYNEEHFHFGPELYKEMVIDPQQRFEIVRNMFGFNVRIPLNMQTTLIGRKAAERVRGGVFQPPFPDHYALNSLLLVAERWVFSPEKLLVVGVSPKSFGHYVYSNLQDGGLAYLGIADDFPGRLPGNALLNGMHVWLNLLKTNYPDFLPGLEINRAGYVRRQVYAWLTQWRLREIQSKDVLRNLGLLLLSDWFGLMASIVDGASWRRLRRQLAGCKKTSKVEARWHGLRPLEGIFDIRQFAQWLEQREKK